MPAGAPREASQAGKRCSSGRISTLPSGDNPATASMTRLVAISQRARRVNRVDRSTTPTSPIVIRIFDGTVKKAEDFRQDEKHPRRYSRVQVGVRDHDRDFRQAA